MIVCVCVVCGVCVCVVCLYGVWHASVVCLYGVWCGVWHACMVCVCVWFVNVKGMASYTIYRPSICIYLSLSSISLLYLSPLTLLPLSFSSLPPLSPFIPLCVLPYSFSLVNSSVIDLTADTSDDEYPIDFR